MHSGALVVALGGVGIARGRVGAEGIRSRRAARRPCRPLAEGEIYWDDLAGLRVMNRAGVVLGDVQGVVRQHGGHPLLRVERPPVSQGRSD